MRTFLLTSALVFAASPVFAQTLFLDDATVVDAKGEKSTADLIVTDGVITQQAATLSAPAGASSVEGAWVTSGLFAPMSSLGLTDIGSGGPGNDAASEDSLTNVSERVADSFNPRSIHIDNVRQSGITHALVAPRSGSDSIFAGTGAIVSLTGEFDSVLISDAFVMVELGETGTLRAGGSRAAAMAQLRAAIDDADSFFKRYADSPDGGDLLSRQDALAFNRATRGDIPLVVRVDRAADIMRVIDIKKDNQSLDIIIVGAAEAWEVADDIAANNVRVILDPLHNLPERFESVGARLDNVMFLKKAGVDFAISNLGALGVTKPATLAQHAGGAVVEGLSWADAFASISTIPASWFGVEDQTTVVWDGDPLEVTSAPISMSINGAPQSMTSRQKALRDRYNPTNTDKRPHKYR
jgi:imidazolonepropionase-like amidohydrolase